MILTEKTMIYSLFTEPRLMEFNIHLLQSKIKQPGKENKSKSKQISHRSLDSIGITIRRCRVQGKWL